MIRIAATLAFALTLLCPIFCLAEGDGECPDHDRPAGSNCEAMSVGAIVAIDAETAQAPLDRPAPTLDLAFLAIAAAADPHHPTHRIPWTLARARPPSAATRQALLQTYLF